MNLLMRYGCGKTQIIAPWQCHLRQTSEGLAWNKYRLCDQNHRWCGKTSWIAWSLSFVHRARCPARKLRLVVWSGQSWSTYCNAFSDLLIVTFGDFWKLDHIFPDQLYGRVANLRWVIQKVTFDGVANIGLDESWVNSLPVLSWLTLDRTVGSTVKIWLRDLNALVRTKTGGASNASTMTFNIGSNAFARACVVPSCSDELSALSISSCVLYAVFVRLHNVNGIKKLTYYRIYPSAHLSRDREVQTWPCCP